MRRFKVWAEVAKSSCVIELPDDMTLEECDGVCREALDSLLENGDTGWNELESGEELPKKRGSKR